MRICLEEKAAGIREDKGERLEEQKVALSFLNGKLRNAESVLFRCTKIRKSKSA